MKKKSLFLLTLLFPAIAIFAREIPEALKLKSYQLKNGLTVYLNEDHSSSSVMGMIAVKGGSKRDPKDATGIAHYFEHIMFKGSEKLGTVDFEAEKVYLDSIATQYELLGNTEDKAQREAIQLKINGLSLNAAEYAIPNEFDRIITQMGGTGLNAFTSYEFIGYLNSFPANQMEKWLEVYSDRFENPVFRMFQSELETVYEEKNMSADDMSTPFFEGFMKELFKGTPYGEQTVLGSADHLKNPSLAKMRDYFETYYVPNNMALILTGDFDAEMVMPLIEEKFGHFQSKPLPVHDKMELTPFAGRHFVKKRLMPIKVGVLGYHTVPQGHPDQLALKVCTRVMSNYSSTGLLDELVNDNQLMEASMEDLAFGEVGSHLVVMVPKIIGQSLNKTEELVLGQMTRLKKGDFEQSLLDGVKLEMIKENEENIENAKWRAYSFMETFIHDQKWADVLSYSDRINALTKEDIVAVANTYFGEDYLAFYSKMGFPKKDKVDKPAFKPIAPQNTEAKSEYFKVLSDQQVSSVDPRFIEEGTDYTEGQLADNARYFYVKNPINQVFSLDMKFKMGTVEAHDTELAADVLGYCGTKELPYADFLKELQKLGAEFYTYANSNYLTVHVSGIESNLDATLKLMNDLLSDPQMADKEKVKMVRELKFEKKWNQKDVSVKSDALLDYALYKANSEYLLSPNAKELKRIEIESMLKPLHIALKRSVDLHYVGAIGSQQFADVANQNLTFMTDLVPQDKWYVKPQQEYAKNVIYFVHDKKAVQTQIRIVVQGDDNRETDQFKCRVFNEYFSGDMSSIVFQEIREFRSLAYMAYGYYKLPYDREAPGYFLGHMTTQADKTIEALETYTCLINDMPAKPERMDIIKTSLKQSINSKRPSFRSLSSGVPMWKYQGFEEDPNKVWYPEFNSINFDQVDEFYNAYMTDKPMVITLVGDKSRIDMDELKKFGEIVEVKTSDIFN